MIPMATVRLRFSLATAAEAAPWAFSFVKRSRRWAQTYSDARIAKPKKILPVSELPKTRSGKIMRRLLRDVAENRQLGDVTTLTDSTVMDLIQAKLPSSKED